MTKIPIPILVWLRPYGKTNSFDSAKIYINKAMNVQRPIFAEGYGSLASLARERNDLKSALAYYKLAYKETASDEMLYFNICTVADQLYKDPKIKLETIKISLKSLVRIGPMLQRCRPSGLRN